MACERVVHLRSDGVNTTKVGMGGGVKSLVQRRDVCLHHHIGGVVHAVVVITLAAVHEVRALTAIQQVTALVAQQHVVALTAEQAVIAGSPDQLIVSTQACERVAQVVRHHAVVKPIARSPRGRASELQILDMGSEGVVHRA